MVNRNPKVNLNITNANLRLATNQRKPLIFAQGTASGSYTSGDLITNIPEDFVELEALFGERSMAYLMARSFKELNNISRLDALVVDDNGGGTAATGSAVFSGTPTENGTLFITVGSNRNNRYAIPVTTSSTATTLGDALEAAITDDNRCPATASNTTGTVTLTAANAGSEGNNISLRVEGSVAGVAVALTEFTGGATDPSLTGILDKIDEERYDIIAPVAFLADIKAHLNAKFNVDNDVLDGIGFVAKTDTFSNHITALSSESSQNVVYITNKKLDDSDFKGSVLGELDYVISAQMEAFRAKRFIENVNIASFMQAGNTRGGANKAPIPYFNMRFNNLPAIPETKNFSSTQLNALRNAGGTTFSMDSGRTVVLSNEVMLTSFDSLNPTPTGLTFKFLNDNDTLTTAREYIFLNLKERFAQSALYEGEIPAGIVGANKEVVKNYLVDLWTDLTSSDFGVLQGGNENRQAFEDSIEINIDTENGIISGTLSLRRTAQARDFTFDITPVL